MSEFINLIPDAVQPEQDGGEDVCGNVQYERHACQLTNVPPSAHTIYAHQRQPQ